MAWARRPALCALALTAAMAPAAEAAELPRLTISDDRSPCGERVLHVDDPTYLYVDESGSYGLCVSTTPTTGLRLEVSPDGGGPLDPSAVPQAAASGDLAPCTTEQFSSSSDVVPVNLRVWTSEPGAGTRHSVCVSTAPGEGTRFEVAMRDDSPILFEPGTAMLPGPMLRLGDTSPCTQRLARVGTTDLHVSSSPVGEGATYSICLEAYGLPVPIRVDVAPPWSGLTLGPGEVPSVAVDGDRSPCTVQQAYSSSEVVPHHVEVLTSPPGSDAHSVCVVTGPDSAARLEFRASSPLGL